MDRNEKAEVIAEVLELINNSTAVYLTDYSGINVEDVNKLRGEFREKGVTYKVVKNTLFTRALNESGKFEKLSDHLTGMTSYAFATEDNPLAPAKIIHEYHKETEKLPLKACYVETNFYTGDRLKELASLPSKEEIISSIIGSIQNPMQGIAGAVNAVMRDLVGVIDAISKKEAA